MHVNSSWNLNCQEAIWFSVTVGVVFEVKIQRVPYELGQCRIDGVGVAAATA